MEHKISKFEINHDNNNNRIKSIKNLKNIYLFSNSPAIYIIEKIPTINGIDMGDHDLFICQIIGTFCGSEKDINYNNILTTELLRNKGIL